MSFEGEVRKISRSSLNELDRLQKEAAESSKFEELSDFLFSIGEDLDYEYSGSVIFDLFNFLRDKKEVDLEKNDMSGFVSDFLESIEDGVAVYSLFGRTDKDRFLKLLDPSLISEGELQSYIDEENKAYKDQYVGYGSYMKDTLKFIHTNLRGLDDDHLLFIGVFY